MRFRLKGRAAILAFAVALAASVPAATAAFGGARAAANHTVILKSKRFHPGTLSIHRGDTVTWVWRDSPTEHNVTGRGFKSATMSHGSFRVRFSRRGTFNYHCTIHVEEGMRGKIIVH